MKKSWILILSLIFIFTKIITVYGDEILKLEYDAENFSIEESKKIEIINESENNQYETEKKILISEYSNLEIPDEMKLDFDELNNLNYLVKKTDEDYEIVRATDGGNYFYLDSTSNLNLAKEIADNFDISLENNDATAIINKEGQIIYSPLAMGKVIKYVNGIPYPKNDKNTDIYTDSGLKTKLTYINHGYIDDVPIIEDVGTSAKIQVSGVTGWINKDSKKSEFDMIVVPLNQVTNPSYYKNENGVLKHFISTNITGVKEAGNFIDIGMAPSFMSYDKEYYSYDGNYFYNTLNELIVDLKNNKKTNSINEADEFYSYYLNLPFRSNTEFTINELNNFIEKNTKDNSKLRGIGASLIEAERQFGVNAGIILSIAINESNWGLSSIAQSKNNIFGINAVDSNPGQAANQFNTVNDCINEFAKNYISRGYADPEDWRYEGAHLGNKKLGANVRYASDPFWGEKATKYLYLMDRNISGGNLKEFNSKKIGIHINESDIKDEYGNVLYSIKNNSSKAGKIGTTIVINSNDKNGLNYNIHPHRTTPIKNGEFDGFYSWNGKSTVESSSIKIINDDIKTYKDGINYKGFIEGTGWQSNKHNGETSGTVGEGKRLEAVKLNLKGYENLNLRYRVHVQDLGWQEWRQNDETAGLPNSGKRIEAIEIQLDDNQKYSIEYRTHIENIGWQEWKRNGELAGTTGEAKRLEAIEIRLISDDNLSNFKYKTHIQDQDWGIWNINGDISGTEGEAKRLEAIVISVDGLSHNSDLQYRTHIQNEGWQNWKNNLEVSGTQEEQKRVEAIQINLNDRYSYKYKIEYRVHVENEGWQPWKENGEIAGTTGEAKRVEAIQIKLIEK
ncbi:MAG: glucosaminidase domain-containing protein [Sarcina sp.]